MAAKKIGHPVSVLVAGKSVSTVAEQVAALDGVSNVLVSDDAAFEHTIAENMANLVKELQSKKNFSHIISSASPANKNWVPRAAFGLDVQPVGDVISVVSEDTFIHPIYAGNALATVKSRDALKMMTVRSTSFDKVAAGSAAAPIEPFAVASADAGKAKFVSAEVVKSDRPDLGAARVVVSGGRGLKSGDNFAMLNDLADVVGGAVGASRAAVDAGYVPNDLQVGQTGKIVAPEFYFAVGISGAIQHLAGMKDSKTIIAVNKDADAPIFQVADYGVVGDLFEVVPQLTEKLKAAKK
jgi:electron transfer flavoprotein alpha subunit